MGIYVGKMLRALLSLLDGMAYGLVSLLYQLFIKLSDTGIFTPEVIGTFASRIYFFLGLAMLFKVSISIVNYIMNPDLVKDNKTGAGKLLQNIVIILVGIVAVPYIFEAGYSLQRIIVRENIIPNLILGVKYNDNNNTKNASNAKTTVSEAGNNMAFVAYTAFVHFTDEYFSQECYTSPFVDSGEWNEACIDDARGTSKLLDQISVTEKAELFKAYKNKDAMMLVALGVANMTIKNGDKEVFLYDYMLLVVTAAGLFIAYVLLVFCFDVALRSVKLGFLQLIAPIPLIAKLDPKKGDEIFNKWVKECISTYLSLFGRIIAIFFAIFLIDSISSAYYVTDGINAKVKDPFVHVFIIFGILLFVKELPKLLETLTGVKLGEGGLSLNKRLKDVASSPVINNPLGRNLLGGVYSAANGRGFANGWRNAQKQNKSPFADLIPELEKDRTERLDNKIKNDLMDRQRARGEKMWRNGEPDADAIFGRGHEDVKEAYNLMKQNKENRNAAQSTLRNAQRRFEAAQAKNPNMSEKELAKWNEYLENCQKAYDKQEAAYNKSTEEFNMRVNADAGAKVLWDAHESYDRHSKVETGGNGTGYNVSESAPSTGSSSSPAPSTSPSSSPAPSTPSGNTNYGEGWGASYNPGGYDYWDNE